jgi:methanogenic corrinoid protein MtbC1
VALLRWLKRRVDDGQPISRAAAELAEMRRAGQLPELPPALPGQGAGTTGADAAAYADALYRHLTSHDQRSAIALLAEITASTDLETFCTQIVTPVLWAVGDAWERGAIRIATEHFASQFLRGQLMTMFQSLPLAHAGPRIVVGCAPHEMHDIGGLMFALLLRRSGYNVEFLGPDLHLGDLLEYARADRPALICLAASSLENARKLQGFSDGLAGMRPRPKFGFGGRAFNGQTALQERLGGVFLGETVPVALGNIRRLLNR